MDERTGEAFELGERLTVVGRRLAAGDRAPGFALDHFDSARRVSTVACGTQSLRCDPLW